MTRHGRRPATHLGALLLLALVASGCARTSPATDVATTAATLNGVINPEGRPTAVYFEYGATTSYGSVTARKDAGAGTTDGTVSARVTGLAAATTYHFRLCGDAPAVGKQCGTDEAFTTKAAGFQEEVVLQGLQDPTALRFSPDGRVFVTEKRGVIKVFDSLGDPTGTEFADLSSQVDDFFDRGLLGLALDPGFPDKPYLYVAYVAEDPACADHFGGCAHEGLIARLTADGDRMTGQQQVLVKGACFQFPGHSMNHLQFGADGALYVSAGDGASPIFLDYGQNANVCGDPPSRAGTNLTAPLAEGGMMRSQDLRTLDDPVALNGAILRMDPATGDGLPDNPLASSSDPMARRVVAYGLRNPYRFTIRPGTRELWIADNGRDTWEEINRVPDTAAKPPNFGWPCYEGEGPQPGYAALDMKLCRDLYAEPAGATKPFFAYNHDGHVVASDGCPTGGSSVGGPLFKPSGGSWPARYDGAFFFLDFVRECIWMMPAGAGGMPDVSAITLFRAGLHSPVDAVFGPDHNLYYASVHNGAVYRIRHVTGNITPVAVAAAAPTSGRMPLTVQFDGSQSHDADAGDVLQYAWDLDADGAFDDSSVVRPSYSYATAGSYAAALRVTDENGAIDEDRVTIDAGNTAPTVTIAQPTAATRWGVGEDLTFTGTATDEQDGTLPASAFSWQLALHHCNDNGTCHTHDLQAWTGTRSSSFVPPNHSYPAYLVLNVTVTDSGGLRDRESVRLDPRAVQLTAVSDPPGLQLVMNGAAGTSPLVRTVIDGSESTVAAPSPQVFGGASYIWSSWSDGGAQSHNVMVTGADRTLTARFTSTP